MKTLPQRVIARNEVMYNPDLTLRARMLYYLIDDKAGDDDSIWWHWRKLALLLGVGKAQYFAVAKELKSSGIVTVKHEGSRCYYNIQTVRKIGQAVRKIRLESPENRTLTAPYLISDPVHDPVALTAIAEDPENQPPKCYRCRDTGREILGKCAVCRCEAGSRLRRVA